MNEHSTEALPRILETSSARIDPVVLWNVPDLWHARIVNRLASHMHVERYRSEVAFSECVRRHPMAVYVVALSGLLQDVAQLDVLCRAMHRAPNDAVAVAVAFDTELSTSSVVRLAKAGFADVLLVHDGDGFDALLRWIQSNRPRTLYSQVWSAIAPYVEPQAAQLLKGSLRLAYAPYSVAALAKACGCSERNLRRLSVEAGLGSPVRLIALSRLIVAGYLLDRERSRIEWVSHFLEFESPAALRAKARRWIGSSTTVIARAGWIASIGAILMERE